MTTGKKLRTLSHPQFFRLCQWMQTNREEILQRKLIAKALAEICSKQLDYTISPSAVKGALKAVGIEYNPTPTSRHDIGNLNGGRQQRERQIAAFREAIIYLFENLGAKLPEKFLEDTAPYQKPVKPEQPINPALPNLHKMAGPFNGQGFRPGDKVGS